jgi:Phytanoyl-CoA dioxygenase (PhyH)
MDTVFADGPTEQEFCRDGYVVRPFLDPSEVAALTRLHETLPPDLPGEFYATVFSRDPDYRRRVSDGIGAIMAPGLARQFPHHELCFAVFVTKQPRTSHGRLPLHRDYSFVDTPRRTAVHLWCPLIDVDESNGCLHVVKGSHRLINCPYAVNEYPPAFTHVMGLLERDFVTRVPMPAGATLAYESRLFHGSGENESGTARPACVAILVPRGVAPRLYVWDDTSANRFDVLEVTKEFLLQMERGAPIRKPYPTGVTGLGSVEHRVDPLRPQDLATLTRTRGRASLARRWLGALAAAVPIARRPARPDRP